MGYVKSHTYTKGEEGRMGERKEGRIYGEMVGGWIDGWVGG